MHEHCLRLLQELGEAGADLLLVGDGSGTTFSEPCGWACVMFEVHPPRIHFERGGSTSGTNNLAELTPYVHCLWRYKSQLEKSLGPDGLVDKMRDVVIVSDSEWVVKCGRGEYEHKALAHLWGGMKTFFPFFLKKWYHRPRMSNEMLRWADMAAREARLKMQELKHDGV